MKTDIAVIEEYDPLQYKWDVVAWIGSERRGGEIDFTEKRLRIRYLNNTQGRPSEGVTTGTHVFPYLNNT